MDKKWVQTGAFPKRMHDEIKHRQQAAKPIAPSEDKTKRCAQCGGEHPTRAHDKEHRKRIVASPVKKLQNRVPAIQTHRGIQLPRYKQVLTHKQLRAAKKRFPQHKHIPRGFKLDYAMQSSVNAQPHMTEKLKREFDALDRVALEKFHMPFDTLRRQNQYIVIDLVVKARGDESVVQSVSRRG